MKIKKLSILLLMSFITSIYSIVIFIIILLYSFVLLLIKQENFDKIVTDLWSNIPKIDLTKYE
jgi:hypothetical protein